MRQRRISAAKYLALMLAAEEFGGVGSGAEYVKDGGVSSRGEGAPCCAYGLAHFAGIKVEAESGSVLLSKGLPFHWHESDSAVSTARLRLGMPIGTDMRVSKLPRVPFHEWATEMDLVPVGGA